MSEILKKAGINPPQPTEEQQAPQPPPDAQGVRVPMEVLRKSLEKIKDDPQPVAAKDIQETIKKIINNEPIKEEKKEEPKKEEEKAKSKLETYIETLKANNISEEEAIEILVGVYYKGEYSKKYKIVGRTVEFQITPPKFQDVKYILLNQIGPLYRQHEVAVTTDINVAAAIKSIDGEVLPTEPPAEALTTRYKRITELNQYFKASLINKYLEFEKMMAIVTQTDGVDDFFEAKKNSST